MVLKYLKARCQIGKNLGNAMQGMMGNYLEKNIHTFIEIQKKLQAQSSAIYGGTATPNAEAWSEFLKMQGPAIQGFTPATGTTSTTSTQAKAAFVYGGGVDLGITKRLSVRVGYRGLLYKSPDFKVITPFIKTGAITHLAEPVGGLTFRF